MKNFIFSVALMLMTIGCWEHCGETPVTVTNNTGTNIIDGYFTISPGDYYNLIHGESETRNWNNYGFPYYEHEMHFVYRSPIFGETEASNIHLQQDMQNFVTINTDNSVTLEYETIP